MTVKLHNRVISVCYRPPNGSGTHFLDYLETFLAFTTDSKLDKIFDEDTIIIMMKNDSPKHRPKTLLKCNECSNTMKLATIVTKNTSSLIDVFITNLNSVSVNAGVFVSDLSDHIPIFYVSMVICGIRN